MIECKHQHANKFLYNTAIKLSRISFCYRSTPAKDLEPNKVAKFNSSKGTLYEESWGLIRGEVKSSPGGKTVLGHDALAATPRDILAPPAMWMVVELYTGPPPLRAALYIRMDSLVGVQE